MIRLRFTTLLLLILCSSAIAAEDPLDAVVQIWVNDQLLGAGFFVSKDGQILTAYHVIQVIQDAHKIRVLHRGDSSSKVLVESYAPGRDLATLRIRNWKKPTPYLKLAYALPAGVADEKLQVFGHGAFIADQRIEARMPTAGLRPSEQIRGKNGERIFALNMSVIYLDANINSGMSGGPVVSSRGVIGVLSGSLSEGGSIAWAIPSEYAQPQFMQSVNKRPDEIRAWPPLTLMDSGWKNLRAAVAVRPELASAIDRYFLAVEKNTSHAERIPALASTVLAEGQIVKGIIEKGATPEDWLVSRHKAKVEEFERAGNDWNQDRAVLSSRIVELASKLAEIYDSTPATQQNVVLFERFYNIMQEYKAEYKKMTEPFLQGEKATQSRITELLAKLSGRDIAPADQLNVLVELEKLYASYTGWDFQRFSIGEAQMYERLGSEVQRLLTSRLEGRDANWRFSSERGYTIVFPAGWELEIYPPAPSRLDEKGLKILEEFTAECHNLGWNFEALLSRGTIVNGVRGTDFVRLKIVTRSGQGLVGAMTEAERRDIIARLQREGLHEIETERETIKGNWVTITRAKYGDTPGTTVVEYYADFQGTRGILSLVFYMSATHAASVITSCRRVVEATEYK